VTDSEPTATAHQVWDRNWNSAEQRARWLKPEPLVQSLVPLLRARNLTRVLDVGCGLGRHAHYLACQGFTCSGIDASETGLAYARSEAAKAHVRIDYRAGLFYALAYAERSFDAVIAWNVIYHGDGAVAQRAIDQIARVLVPGGLCVGSMLSKRNAAYGSGRQVSQDTFVVEAASDDKVHPHYYVDARTLVQQYNAFEVLELRDVEQSPGAFHWQFVFERRA
jgi:tellurite methyltransferase